MILKYGDALSKIQRADQHFVDQIYRNDQIKFYDVVSPGLCSAVGGGPAWQEMKQKSSYVAPFIRLGHCLTSVLPGAPT